MHARCCADASSPSSWRAKVGSSSPVAGSAPKRTVYSESSAEYTGGGNLASPSPSSPSSSSWRSSCPAASSDSGGLPCTDTCTASSGDAGGSPLKSSPASAGVISGTSGSTARGADEFSARKT